MSTNHDHSKYASVKDEPTSSHYAEADSSTNASSAGAKFGPQAAAEKPTRQNNLHRIQLRKEKVRTFMLVAIEWSLQLYMHLKSQVYQLPKNLKMAKLAMYSACQAPECRCCNWKTPEENRNRDFESSCPLFTEECRNPICKHPLGR